MNQPISLQSVLGAATGEEQHMLGKLLYFSLSNLLVDREELAALCDAMGLHYGGSSRLSVADAFRSATGDVRERIVCKRNGETQIYQVYCRDNRRTTRGVLSRELVKETVNRQTNQYEKLANICYDRDSCTFHYDNLVYDADVDVTGLCRRAEELFELYQTCANRRQVETICVNYIRSLEATKISINGHLFFVPRHTMGRVDVLEDFLAEINRLNRTQLPVLANSIYVLDDARQREKMTEEFYSAVKKEIADYQERASYLIQSGSQSPAILERWVARIDALEEKKRHYETILRRELDGLDEEFSALQLLSQELAIRARGLRFQKAA